MTHTRGAGPGGPQDEEHARDANPPIRWPPPGLERMQGDLWRVASKAALAGGLLVLPLVFVLARTQGLASLGPFGDAAWVMLFVAVVGLGFAIDALVSAARLLRRCASAVDRGYDLGTVLYVTADHARDMGFLLQGRRHFSGMGSGERRTLARGRVTSVLLYVVAGLWLPVGLTVCLLAAARGWLGADRAWMATLVPSVVLYAVGGTLAVLAERRVTVARRWWFARPWADDLVVGEIETWREGMASQTGVQPRTPGASAVVGLRRTAVLFGALTAAVAVPLLTVLSASAIGPLIATVSIPQLASVQERAAKVEAFRGYRVQVDPAVSPEEAGRILHELAHVNRTGVGPGEREPRRTFDLPWLPPVPEGENPTGIRPHLWGRELFYIVESSPSQGLLDYLRDVAAHPGHELFTRVARAQDLDVAAARWHAPFSPGTTIGAVPVPKLSGLREAAYAHVGAAALVLADGRPDEAETMVREVISLGFLMGDRAPTLIDNIVGHVITGLGGDALEGLYAASGRRSEAEALGALRAATERAAQRTRVPPHRSLEAHVQAMPRTVLDEQAVRGIRWEAFILTATLAPCLNLHRVVFGPDETYAAFVRDAEAALVRWPSEGELFRLARAGYLGAPEDPSPGPLGRFLAIAMRGGEGSCASVVRRLRSLDELR